MSICHTAAVFVFFCHTILVLTCANPIPALISGWVPSNAGMLTGLIITIALLAYCLLKIARLSRQVKYQQVIIAAQKSKLVSFAEIIEQNGQNKAGHIGHFVLMISGYLTKFERLQRTTKRHIAVKTYHEILPSFNQIDIKEERSALCSDFDRYFLNAFPHFVSEFNALLKKDDQIWPKRIGQLNTELRIFALMKLGINDCDTIAEILQYSANTIYVYKMRIKAKFNLPAEENDDIATLLTPHNQTNRYVISA